MLSSSQSQSQPATQPKGQKFVPPIFGQWQTGNVLVGKRADATTSLKQAHVVNSMADALTLLPAGVRVEFKIGFDKTAREGLYEMILVPPFPPESCSYGTLWTSCIGQAGHQRPDPTQKPISREFSLSITTQDVFDAFAAVGATANDVYYRVRGNGHSFEGEYYVSKDRQTMWVEVFPGETYTIGPNGSRTDTVLPAVHLQIYHRIPAGKTGK